MRDFNDLLKKIRFSDIEIKSLVSMEKRMEDDALDVNSNVTEKISGTKNLNGVYDIVNCYIDLGQVIHDKLVQLLEDKKIALDMINTLDNSIYRIILIERYFNSQSWRSIAFLINRSEKWTRCLHRKALIELKNLDTINC